MKYETANVNIADLAQRLSEELSMDVDVVEEALYKTAIPVYGEIPDDGVALVPYSDKVFVVIGNTYDYRNVIKEYCSEKGGNAKFNGNLTVNGSKVPGWMVLYKLMSIEEMREHLESQRIEVVTLDA